MPLLCWFDYFLDIRAEICQIFRWFFGKPMTPKRHSEIHWPLVHICRLNFVKLSAFGKNWDNLFMSKFMRYYVQIMTMPSLFASFNLILKISILIIIKQKQCWMCEWRIGKISLITLGFPINKQAGLSIFRSMLP